MGKILPGFKALWNPAHGMADAVLQLKAAGDSVGVVVYGFGFTSTASINTPPAPLV